MSEPKGEGMTSARQQPATYCKQCGMPGPTHAMPAECISALRDQVGSMELAAEAGSFRRPRISRRPEPQDQRHRTYLALIDRRKPTMGHVLCVLQEQYQLISALEERVRILDAERAGQRNNLLAFPGEDRA